MMTHGTHTPFSLIYSLSYPSLSIPILPSPVHPTLGIGEKGAKQLMNKRASHVSAKSFWQTAYRVIWDKYAPASSSSRSVNPLWGWLFQPEPPLPLGRKVWGESGIGEQPERQGKAITIPAGWIRGVYMEQQAS